MNQSDYVKFAGLFAEIAKQMQMVGNAFASLSTAPNERPDGPSPQQEYPTYPAQQGEPAQPVQSTQVQPAQPAQQMQPAQPAPTEPAAQAPAPSPAQPAQPPQQTAAPVQSVDPFMVFSDRLRAIRTSVQGQIPAFNQQMSAAIERYVPGATTSGRGGLRELQEAQYPNFIAEVEQIARGLGAQI